MTELIYSLDTYNLNTTFSATAFIVLARNLDISIFSGLIARTA